MAAHRFDLASRYRYRRLLRLQALAFTLLLILLAFYRQMLSLDYGYGILLTLLGLMAGYGQLLYSLHISWTPADVATVTRCFLGIAALMLAYLGEDEMLWVFGMMVFACLGDWIDGRLADRYGATPQGGILDAETDQMLTFMLAVLGITLGGLGSWLLLFPFYRYGYVLLLESLAVPADNPKPKEGNNLRARVVSAITQVALLVNLVPIALVLKTALSLLALAFLTYSFAADIFYQLHKRFPT